MVLLILQSAFTKDGCYNVSAGVLRGLQAARFNARYIEIDQSNLVNAQQLDNEDIPKGSTCIWSKAAKVYSCRIKSRLLHLNTPKNVSLYAYHPCFDRQSMDFTADISLWTGIKSNPCVPMKRSSKCYGFYHSFYLPNTLGVHFKQDAEAIHAIGKLLIDNPCHQHMEQFLCRMLFPTCTNKGSISPCRSMCFEVVHACQDFFISFISIYVPLKQTSANFVRDFICNQFPNGGLCYQKNVTCKVPKEIENGFLLFKGTTMIENETSVVPVHSTAIYECYKDYELDGDATVVCGYSGEWSTLPKCFPISNKKTDNNTRGYIWNICMCYNDNNLSCILIQAGNSCNSVCKVWNKVFKAEGR